MLNILKAKTKKTKKENGFVVGTKGTGMVRLFLKPIISVTGDELQMNQQKADMKASKWDDKKYREQGSPFEEMVKIECRCEHCDCFSPNMEKHNGICSDTGKRVNLDDFCSHGVYISEEEAKAYLEFIKSSNEK